MDISNRALALLLLMAIIISVAGTLVSLNKLSQKSGTTGYAVSTDASTASVTIQSNTVLRFVVNSIDFGTGYVNTSGGYIKCIMNLSTNTTTITKTGCANFNTTGNPLVLENAGTTFLNVTINSTKDASTFIGGTSPAFQYMIAENETGSCKGTLSSVAWTTVVAGTAQNICSNLTYIDSNDSLKMGIQVTIPYDSGVGGTDTFTATGTSMP